MEAARRSGPGAGNAILVFAKAPAAGHVKTRLIPRLGPEGAVRLHERLVERTLATAVAADVGEVELWCTPDAAHPFFARCAGRYGVPLRRQAGADLGQRMHDAFERTLARHARALLVGSDCPVLQPAHLREAFQALEDHDAVFVPAEDGGYVLVGLKRAAPQVFERVAWGSPEVMAQTRSRLAAAGLDSHELPALWDVDRPEDLDRLQAAGLA